MHKRRTVSLEAPIKSGNDRHWAKPLTSVMLRGCEKTAKKKYEGQPARGQRYICKAWPGSEEPIWRLPGWEMPLLSTHRLHLHCLTQMEGLDQVMSQSEP